MTPSERNNDSLNSNESSREVVNDDMKIRERLPCGERLFLHRNNFKPTCYRAREKREITDPLTRFEEANANLMESVLENGMLVPSCGAAG